MSDTAEQPAAALFEPLDDERKFYEAYAWAVNATPTLAEGVSALGQEIHRLRIIPRDWRRREVMVNVWLLACAISDSIDDDLLGAKYDFSKMRTIPLGGVIVRPLEHALALWSSLRLRQRRTLAAWRDEWEHAVAAYALDLVRERAGMSDDALGAAAQLELLLTVRLPPDALRRRMRFPSAFRSQELTIDDVISLADMFAKSTRDFSRPILVVGLRTAGSYFAPILRACLTAYGWASVDSVTIRPKRGASTREERKLVDIAHRSGLVVITDEPIGTGASLIKSIRLLQRTGVTAENIVALLPVHPHKRDFSAGMDAPALSTIHLVRFEPEQRHKERLLSARHAELILRTYFEHNGESVEAVIEDARNAWLEAQAETTYHTRAKRLYEVRVRTQEGLPATRYVLGKSVGFGWLSYHAFLAGTRLAGFVPPVLGLRDGILYTEWIPQTSGSPEVVEGELRERIPRCAARYIAARTSHLRLPTDLNCANRVDQKALGELAAVLCKAHGKKGSAFFQRKRILRQLASLPCPMPTLIDGKMRPQEWISSGKTLLKTDFEHHAQGKLELNVVDPAYDLADTMLTWQLSAQQEQELIHEYASVSGDHSVAARLFLHMLLVGTWSISQAFNNVVDPRLVERHAEFDRQYARAVDFLTEQTARYCGRLTGRPDSLGWNAPVVVLDVDGVVDRNVFGFPSTTTAGLLAISLLHAHGYAIAFNSARSLRQLKLYGEYYGGVGLVAEYGSVVWDTLSDRHRVLVSDESLRQLEHLRTALRQLPGVFLNDDYQYSIRARVYTRDGTAALPDTIVNDLIARLGTDRVEVHPTVTETTIVARETNKGVGLSALLALAGLNDAVTLAIGDSSPDLDMFRIATRSYAPGHILCRSAAELLGCRIAARGYQPGFLESVRDIVHSDGRPCDTCRLTESRLNAVNDHFVKLLRVADEPTWSRFLRATLHPSALDTFRTA